MDPYYKKYKKYKLKCYKLKRNIGDIDIVPEMRLSRSTNFLDKNNIYGGKKNEGLEVLNAKDLDIPIKYDKDSVQTEIFFKLSKSNKIFEINRIKFNSVNADIKFSIDDLSKGIIHAITKKDNKKYQLEIVPILTINTTMDLLCWPWIKSLFLGSKKSIINEFREKMKKYMEEINYLKFDCVKNNDNIKFDNSITDMIMISRYILKAKGMLEIEYKDSFNDWIKEFWLITKIIEI